MLNKFQNIISKLVIVCLVIFTSVVLIQAGQFYTLNYLKIDFRIPNALISGIVCGFSVAYSQFFIERKKGVCKNFWIVGTIFSLIAFMVIFMIK